MLEHQKAVLRGVQRNDKLFEKELLKTFKWIDEKESKELYLWVMENFHDTHITTLEKVFNRKFFYSYY